MSNRLKTLLVTFKANLKLFPYDKLSHYQWATWFCLFTGWATLVTTYSWFEWPLHISCLSAAIVASITGMAAGFGGESADQYSNDNSDIKHEVSMKDVVASALGSLPVAIPLFTVWALLTIFK